MFLFVERGIRGGLSQVYSKRRVTANNTYMADKYDASKPETYAKYYDVNNLYGWSMGQLLPYGGLAWADPDIDVLSNPDDTSEGYIMRVDLEHSSISTSSI